MLSLLWVLTSAAIEEDILFPTVVVSVAVKSYLSVLFELSYQILSVPDSWM